MPYFDYGGVVIASVSAINTGVGYSRRIEIGGMNDGKTAEKQIKLYRCFVLNLLNYKVETSLNFKDNSSEVLPVAPVIWYLPEISFFFKLYSSTCSEKLVEITEVSSSWQQIWKWQKWQNRKVRQRLSILRSLKWSKIMWLSPVCSVLDKIQQR